MARYSNEQLREALRRAAESLFERSISDIELDRIVDSYNAVDGTAFEKTIKSFAAFSYLTEAQVRAKASSDNTDRLIDDFISMVEGR